MKEYYLHEECNSTFFCILVLLILKPRYIKSSISLFPTFIEAVSTGLRHSIMAHLPTSTEGADSATRSQPLTRSEDGKPELSTASGTAFETEDVNSDEEDVNIHLRTWIAVVAMFIFNFTGVLALNGPPTVVSRGYPNSREQRTISIHEARW